MQLISLTTIKNKTKVNQKSKFLKSLKGLSRKCLVLDCDNTLWGGVIGEEGLGGIDIGSGYPGSGFKDFQNEILNLYHRGIFLALCSKNNESDVVEVFDNHPEMVLKISHFSTKQINWDNKAVNLIKIAKSLNIGLESLVFVDDSEFECRWVKQQLPQVETLLLRGDSSTFKKQLSEKGYFDSLSFTEEDKRRSEMFSHSAKFDEL
jgi:FkbH-like protein